MPREPEVQPTIRRDPSKHVDLEMTHPAYAAIEAHRVSGQTYLFDSDFQHQHSMVIRIHEARLDRSLSTDRVYPGRRLIEVELSMAQWIRFLTNTNADTTPCTLRNRLGDDTLIRVPELPRPTPKADLFKDDVSKDIEQARAALRALDTKIAGMTDLSQKKIRELRSLVSEATRKFDDSIPFVAEQFSEHVETEIEKAKTEVHTYIQTAIHQAGLQALQGGSVPPIALPGHEPLVHAFNSVGQALCGASPDVDGDAAATWEASEVTCPQCLKGIR